MRTILLSTLFLSMVGLTGCGGSAVVSTPFEFVDVKGTVTLPDGKPLRTGALTFTPEAGQKAREENATVTDGSFSTKMGVGKYKVTLDADSKAKSAVPGKYRNSKTSDLIVEVSASSNQLTISLK